MRDLIDRQAAIDALFALYEYQRSIDPTEAVELVRQGVSLLEKKIEKLPSARPERKKGKWIGEPKDGIEAMFIKPKCSVCGFESADGKNYCSNCGSFNGGVE